MFVNLLGIAVSGLVAGIIMLHAPLSTIDISYGYLSGNIQSARMVEDDEPTVLFVGDIMLGRGVESRIIEEGLSYPFRYVDDLIEEADVAIGNFEGVVTRKHVHAPSMTFQFSIRNEYLTHLKRVGFDILSLANNHSFDYGIEALDYTRSVCKEIRIACPGSPNAVGRYSLHTEKVGEDTVGFIFVHAALVEPDKEDLIKKLAQLQDSSDIQIAYMHWGDEYRLTHSKTQERLAKLMVDHGVDAVFGHHPHVVEDVELYKGRPIFYSLGNFIFDQYFSDDVQQGLGVELTITDSTYVYTLHGFSSMESRNQPQPMSAHESKELFARILEPIGSQAEVDVAAGTIAIPR